MTHGNVRRATYAGYYIDHRGGGIIHVGFTQNQASYLEELKQQTSLVAPDRIAVYSTAPTTARLSLLDTLSAVEAAWESDPALSNTIASAGIDETTDTIQVTGTDVGLIDSHLKAALGQQASIHVTWEEFGEEFAGRNHTDGRIQAGDRLEGVDFEKDEFTGECTAGFGAWDQFGVKPSGEPEFAAFVLTAGHCVRLGEAWYRSDESGFDHPDRWQRIGHAARTGLPRGGQHYETDGAAIRLNSGGLMPYYIYANGRDLKPVGAAAPARHGETLCFSGVKTNERKCGEMVGVRVRKTKNPGRQLFIITRFAGAPGDSGAPVWSPRTGDAVGLLSGGPQIPYLYKDWVTPLVVPRGFSPEKVPGILNAPGMGSLHLASAGGG